jgi:hypothetical protein
MTARRHKVIVAPPLHNVGDRSAIDLQIENYIPSKVRTSQNDETPTRPSGGGSHRGYANKYKNEKESGGGGVSWLHGLTLPSGRAFGERGVHRLLDFSKSVGQAQ